MTLRESESSSSSPSKTHFREAGAAAAPPELFEQRPYGERSLDRECYWLHLTEDQASAMAGGYVPNSVKSVLRELLDYALQDELRAARPVRKAKR